jgi:endonuclease YncB( thermonuclease family)
MPDPRATLLALLVAVAPALAQAPAPTPAPTSKPTPTTAPAPPRPERKPQPRPHGSRVVVPADKVRVDDGDTIDILWGENDRETVRILGIDTPETRHVEHDLPYAQSFGYEARSFGLGAFAVASKIEVLRSDTLDPYGRTLGYVFLDGRNYSALVVRARLAEESISRYGDNGFPKEAAEVLAAAKAAGPLPFESPGDFRRRMREVSRAMKERGEQAP